MTEAPLLTSQEVADRLGKSPRTVHRLVTSGALVPVRKLAGRNGAFLFLASDVESLTRKNAA